MTRFNSEVSPHRVFETRRFALADFKAMRGLADGATINDVVLAVCAGGLRRYLDMQGELPEESLVAAAPIAVHGEGKEQGQAVFSWVRLEVGTDIADPVERLETIHATSSSSDVMAQAVSARELIELAEHAPSAAIAATSKMLRSASALLGNWAPLANCAIANVPGPRVPLYLHGARLTYVSAIMPISDGMGLVFSVTSYSDMIVVSFTACYEQLPDPEVFAVPARQLPGIPGAGAPPGAAQGAAGGGQGAAAQGGCPRAQGTAPQSRQPRRGTLSDGRTPAHRIRVARRPVASGHRAHHGPRHAAHGLARQFLPQARRARLPRGPLRQPRLRPLRPRAGEEARQPVAGHGGLGARPAGAHALHAGGHGGRRRRPDGPARHCASAYRRCLDGWHDRPGTDGEIPAACAEPDLDHVLVGQSSRLEADQVRRARSC
jgi:hypothetical protein